MSWTWTDTTCILCTIVRKRFVGKLILRAFFARLPDGSTILFCYYLLGGDTAASSGLYARFCHTFLVFFVSESQLHPPSLSHSQPKCYLFILTLDFSFFLQDVFHGFLTASSIAEILFVFFAFLFCHIFSVYGTVRHINLTMSDFERTINIAYLIASYVARLISEFRYLGRDAAARLRLNSTEAVSS